MTWTADLLIGFVTYSAILWLVAERFGRRAERREAGISAARWQRSQAVHERWRAVRQRSQERREAAGRCLR
jgi:hypothetical protein